MKTYVINLPRSPVRREHMEVQLDRLGLDHTFVVGVDGRELGRDERSSLVDEEAVARHPQWLTPGQIGCALSHRRAYERIVESGEPVGFVVEDDVLLPPDTARLLIELTKHVQGSEAILLYYRSFEPCVFSARDVAVLGNARKLMYPMDIRQPITTAAYVVSREACERLIDLILPVRAGADSWGFFHDNGAVDRLRCVVPRPAHVRTDFKSTIDYVDQGSLRLRFTSAVSERRLFPFHQLLTWNRVRLERRMTRVHISTDRSPLAAAADPES